MNEGDLQRIREMTAVDTSQDAKRAQAWSIEAKAALVELLEHAEAAITRDGGTFAKQLRDALEERTIRELNGRAELTDDVVIHSFAVHVTPEGVLVDVRMKLGVWKQ